MNLPRSKLVPVILIGLVVLLTACGRTKIIVVPQGEPIQIAEPVQTRVFVQDAEGNLVLSSNKVTLPAGWWALPDPE